MKILGHLDLCGPSLIEGWLYCDAPLTEPLRLQVFVGSELLGEVIVDRFRQDVLEAGYGDGYSGFSFPVPMDRLITGFAETRLRLVDSILYVLPDAQTSMAPDGTNGFVAQAQQIEATPAPSDEAAWSRAGVGQRFEPPLRRGGAIFRS